ncbi:hypothetical protein ARMGADRAFT_1061331 [Armillaria gallica]|uniref:Uncharacterized protein n=1 Tax=Armillaria gallica TaxID=47427 RepID=A0A2H3EAX8_ARMGA|nr:hypothetical protein ARMGADRAFT_1061331 [Armillaria gallica]
MSSRFDSRDDLPTREMAATTTYQTSFTAPAKDAASIHLGTDTENEAVTASPLLPEIPTSSNLDFDLSSIISGSSDPDVDQEKVKKRASNVQKLAEENEKLKAELKAMTDRLEAAERKRAQLAQKRNKQQHILEPSST